MKKEIIATAKTVEEAIAKAVEQLGVDTTEVDVKHEILEMPKKGGFFGIGAQPAKVRVSCELPDPAGKTEKAPETKTETRPVSSAPKTVFSQPSAPKKPAAPRYTAPLKASAPAASSDAEPEVAGPDNGDIAETHPELMVRTKSPYSPCAGGDAALGFVKTLIANMELDAKADIYDTEDGKYIDINGESAGILIGHHGDTLDSLQYLCNLAANKKNNGERRDYVKITLDIENYRAKREETLRTLAHRMSERVLKYQKSVTLEPMNPYERRIIHSEVQGIDGVTTTSIGSDSNRRIVIFLEGTQPLSRPAATTPVRKKRSYYTNEDPQKDDR